MNIVSFGGGVNSAAMLVGMYQRGIPIDLILFADVGAERPEIYAFLHEMNDWLRVRGLPPITVVENVDRFGQRLTLEQECLRAHTLPSIAFGHKRCSLKHKIAPQDKFCNHHPGCRADWAKGRCVTKYIGYDAGEGRRRERARERDAADRKYCKVYPLMDWGWTREDCIRTIRRAGLSVPGKSSCFFCPSMKKQEILALRDQHPELLARALALEANAQERLITVKGLGRSWSWADYLNTGKEAA